MHRAFSLLFLMVFALGSLLPAGFMLQATAGEGAGSVEIVICTSHGSKLIKVNADGEPDEQKPGKSDKDTCPYSAAAGKAVAGAAPEPLVQSVRYAALTYRITAELFRATPKPGAVSARGPPSTLS